MAATNLSSASKRASVRYLRLRSKGISFSRIPFRAAELRAGEQNLNAMPTRIKKSWK